MERKTKQDVVIFSLRLALGLILLWAFFDKLFGLGFATTADKSWLAGGSPTYGFLKLATYGPFASFYQSIAGNIFVDVLFMLALLLIGLALVFGIFMKPACYGGAILMFMMWTARLPPEQNPLIDEHIIYGLIFILLAISDSDRFTLKNIGGKNHVI